jgi:EmrB/QacA subfamily drug resistance transporter
VRTNPPAVTDGDTNGNTATNGDRGIASDHGAADGALTGVTQRSILVVLIPLTMVSFIATLDQTIVATAIPGIGRALHNLTDAPWIATAYLLTSAVSTLVLGKLGDMYGRKRIFQFAIVVFLSGSLLCGIAGSLGLLIVFRGLQGIGGGGLSSLVQAITGDLVPARQRAKYQAFIGVVATLAIVAGPILGGVFVDDLSWRWIFLVNLPIGVVALVIIALRLHLPVHASPRRVDVGGAVLATVFTTAALLITVWGGGRYGWGTWPILGLLAAAGLALALYVLAERRVAEPITPLPLFRNPVFSICSALFFLSTLVLFAAMLYVPLLMQEVHHYTAFRSGLFLIPLLAGLVVATGISGGVITRTGRYKLFPVLGALLSGVGMYLISGQTGLASPWLFAALLMVVGLGIGFFVQVSVRAGQNAVEYSALGVATGTLNFFKTMGGAFGAAIFGAILAAQLSGTARTTGALTSAFHTVFLWTLPFMGIALVLALAMKEKPLSEEMREVAAGRVEVAEY